MSFRLLLAILTGLALPFAPLGGQNGSAMAMGPGDHQMQMMESGHCDGQPAKDNHAKSSAMSCCAAMCTALAIAPMPTAGPLLLRGSPQQPALEQSGHSFLAELPTPPPRLA
jgi:hypothetical protein